VHLQTRSITSSKWISKLSTLWPSHSHNHAIQGYFQTSSIKSSKYIFHEGWWGYVGRGVTEVETVTLSTYSADPRVDRHHLISILSYHTMKIHTLSFPTFGLTRCVQDFMYPQCQVASFLLTRFLHSSNQHSPFLWIPFWSHERCGRVLMIGFVPSHSIVSLQRPFKWWITKYFQWAFQGAAPIMSEYQLRLDWPYVHIYRVLNNAWHIMM